VFISSLLRPIDRSCQVSVTETLTYGGLRWLAPELMADSNYVPTTRATDVWSFGMLCIEIFTENVPFCEVTNEMFIPVVIRQGSLPTRPENSAITGGLSDAMWNLMNQCWQRDPTSRPSMTKIRETIQNMHPLRSCTFSIPHSRQEFFFLTPRKPLGQVDLPLRLPI
jgi:son of sevenless